MSALTAISIDSSVTTSDQTPFGQTQDVAEEKLPTASESAVDFLQDVEEDDFKNLLFCDTLVTVSDTGKELGEFKISIEATKHHGIDCFLVHANSHGAIDGVPCGTSIVAYVTTHLDTLEQQHHEYVKLQNHPLDRKTFIVKQEGEYVINRVITQGEDVQRSARTFKAENMQGFISEGSNLLLHRLLVKRGLPDNCQLLSFDSDTNLCPVLYRSLEERIQAVGEVELHVMGVERTINSVTDLPTTWQSYLLKDGHLTSRVQVGSPVTMRVAVAPAPVEEDEEEEKPVFGKQPLNWEEDAELYSKYNARKEELKGDHATYMRQHPELKALLADFLQFLLLRKPDDVLEFAADYFSTFSTNIPNRGPYKHSSVPTPFPMSRGNSKIQYLAQSK